jgi:hypothetical protein
MMAPWADLGAPAVQTAPSEDKRWRSVPACHNDSTPVGMPEPAVRQEEEALPTAEQVEPVELSIPEVLGTSGPVLPAAAAAEDEAGTADVVAGTAEVASAAAAEGAGTEGEYCCQTQQEPSSSSCPQSPGACARC